VDRADVERSSERSDLLIRAQIPTAEGSKGIIERVRHPCAAHGPDAAVREGASLEQTKRASNYA